MKNNVGLLSGFMISSFVHFGVLLFAFLFLKEQAPIQKELFHAISLNDYIAPKAEQSTAQNEQNLESPQTIEQNLESTQKIEPKQESPKTIEPKQESPKKIEQKTQKPKPVPNKIQNSQNSQNSQVLESSKAQQAAQNNAINKKEILAKSLAKEQDEISAQIYKIISAYIAKNYPKDALRRNQSGSVVVSFNYNLSGVSNAQILQSSNIKSLDKASLNAIEKTKHLFPKTDKNFAFKLPIRFAIK